MAINMYPKIPKTTEFTCYPRNLSQRAWDTDGRRRVGDTEKAAEHLMGIVSSFPHNQAQTTSLLILNPSS